MAVQKGDTGGLYRTASAASPTTSKEKRRRHIFMFIVNKRCTRRPGCTAREEGVAGGWTTMPLNQLVIEKKKRNVQLHLLDSFSNTKVFNNVSLKESVL